MTGVACLGCDRGPEQTYVPGANEGRLTSRVLVIPAYGLPVMVNRTQHPVLAPDLAGGARFLTGPPLLLLEAVQSVNLAAKYLLVLRPLATDGGVGPPNTPFCET